MIIHQQEQQQRNQIQESSGGLTPTQMEQLMNNLMQKIQDTQQIQLKNMMGEFDKKIDALNKKIAEEDEVS